MANKKGQPPPPPRRAPPAPPARSGKATGKPAGKPGKSKPAFAKKNRTPSEAELIARLPLPLGRRFESVRSLLKKQEGVSEEIYYYGPRTGWAWRYLHGDGQSLCSIVIHGDRLLGIVALGAAAQDAVDWRALSPIGQAARKVAHGTPALLWLDLPFERTGAADFKALLRAKLRTLTASTAPP